MIVYGYTTEKGILLNKQKFQNCAKFQNLMGQIMWKCKKN